MAQTFAIRLSIEDMQSVRNALQAMGKDGEAAFKAFGNATDRVSDKLKGVRAEALQTTPALRAIDAASKEVRRGFDQWADRIPVFGAALRAIGPAGLAAAAGFVAIGVAINGATRAAKDAITEFSRINDAAEALNVSREHLQGLEAAAMGSGVSAEDLAGILQTLSVGTAKATFDQGRLAKAISAVNPELLDQLRSASSVEGRWNAIAAAVRGSSDAQARQQIVIAAGGAQALKLMPILRSEKSSIEDITAAAKAMGLVIDDSMIRAADAAGDQVDILSRKIKLQWASAMIELAPLIETTSGVTAELAVNIGRAVDAMRPLDRQSGPTLQSQLNERLKAEGEQFARLQEAQRAAAGRDPGGHDIVINQSNEDWLKVRIQAFEKAVAERKQISEEINRRLIAAPGESGDPDRNAIDLAKQVEDLEKKFMPAQQKLRAEYEHINELVKAGLSSEAAVAARAKAREDILGESAALKQQEVALKAVAQARSDLGDHSLQLSQREAELNKLIGVKGFTSKDAAEALKAYRDQIDGTTETEKRWQAAIQAARSPVQQLRDDIARLDAEHAAHPGADGYLEMLDLLREKLKTAMQAEVDAAEATRQSSQAYKDAAAVRQQLAAWDAAALTPAQKLAAEQERVNKLIGGEGGLSSRDVQRYMEGYAKSLGEAGKQTAGLRLQSDALDAALSGQLGTWQSAERVMLGVLRQVVQEWLRARDTMKANSLADGFASLGSFILGGGGGGSSGGNLGGGASAGRAAIKHGGGMIGEPGPSRVVSLDLFRNAPRHHTGLAPRERAIIAEDGERMFSVADNKDLIRAISNKGGGDTNIQIVIHDESGSKVETRETRTGDGRRQIEIWMRRAAVAGAANGDLDEVMAKRYGVNRAAGRRA